jgi:hypothetical protein
MADMYLDDLFILSAMIVVAPYFSASIGVFFGFVPALKA